MNCRGQFWITLTGIRTKEFYSVVIVNIGWAQNYIDAAFIGCGKFFRRCLWRRIQLKQTMIDVFNCIGDADILVPYYAPSEGRSLPLSLNNVSLGPTPH